MGCYNSPQYTAIKNKPNVAMIRNGKSLLIISFLTVKVPINVEIPMTAKMLKILLPIILPTTSAVLLFETIVKDVEISGALVPNATMVNPTITADIFKLYATLLAPSTNMSALLTMICNPKISTMIYVTGTIFFLLFFFTFMYTYLYIKNL